MFLKSNLEKAKERKIEEYYLNIVAQELEQNIKHNPTWAKSIAKSKGDSEKAKSYYIDYRIQSLKDDAILQQDINNQNKAKKKLYEEKQKEENFYKKQKERVKQSNEDNKGKLHPIVTFIIFSIVIIIVFKLLIGVE